MKFESAPLVFWSRCMYIDVIACALRHHGCSHMHWNWTWEGLDPSRSSMSSKGLVSMTLLDPHAASCDINSLKGSLPRSIDTSG